MALSRFKFGSVLKARCPACDQGSVLQGRFAIRPRCAHCGCDFHPEPGFYMGAILVGFALNTALTVPAMILLKVLNVDLKLLLAWPFVEFLFVGTFLLFYCRILWLHLEYRMTHRLDGNRGV